ncbi:hypothetical protein CQY22_001995 [Mycolicibacterium brumae]|uniref:SMP-30/Gluconolactonase/LRE-like region domain-containing protein n=1 Tax=Mycolicibacterium brumae TaxID=85968 RepID=A0A2G5PFG0_9MYCO|nr:hypothetical protein CQY22_001995 [Mycolicibacterium brumae]RWA18392.1 hypothetical protein MBRU_04035 [Mycolicibacterium brumae DSM 44177]
MCLACSLTSAWPYTTSGKQEILPFALQDFPADLAVDSSGDVFVLTIGVNTGEGDRVQMIWGH